MFKTHIPEGYAIDHWVAVENLTKLEDGSYDIIILDIGGVAQQYSKDDGLGVLEHIKKANPAQVVVAFSGQSFDLSKNKFWKLADDALSKPVDTTKCKQTIDALLEQKVTAQHYWNMVVELLKRKGVKAKAIAHIEDKLARALATKDRVSMDEAIKPVLDKAETGVRVVGIVAKIAALCGL